MSFSMPSSTAFHQKNLLLHFWGSSHKLTRLYVAPQFLTESVKIWEMIKNCRKSLCARLRTFRDSI